MIFRLLGQFQDDFQGALVTLFSFILALVIGITVHEFSHALSAFRLGDNTAKNLGRLTLNPRAHLDPYGTIMILIAGFGWGKPTPVSPWNLHIGEKTGMALVSLAGPISNVIVASTVGLILRFYLDTGAESILVIRLLSAIIQLNIVLAVFNLIPVAPLDGFKIALGILPRDAADSFAKTERYGMMILFGVIMLDIFMGVGILGRIIGPIIDVFFRLVLS